MFMRHDVAQTIGRLFNTGVVPTVAQLEELRASRAGKVARGGSGAGASSEPDGYTVVGNTAEIRVCGVLSEEPDFWAWLLGVDQTCYSDIRDGFALAAANPAVTNVVMVVSSPGGYVDGLFETLAAIESFAKPIKVVASLACSAAYALAAMAGPIQAVGPASEFGSVGVCKTFFVDPEQVDITSTEAPNKRPNVTTEEGKAVVRAELDAFHEIFVDAIARGRTNATGQRFTVAQVNADFGRGGTVIADAAKAAGMIDRIPKAAKRGSAKAAADDGDETPIAPARVVAAVADPKDAPAPAGTAVALVNQPPRITGPTRKQTPMTEEELLAQFPQLHASMLAKGAAQGQAGERKRVSAHLKLAKSTGAMDVALKSIENGASVLDEDVHAEYLSAGINRRAQNDRQSEADQTTTALTGAVPAVVAGAASGTAGDIGDQVAFQALGAPKKETAGRSMPTSGHYIHS
jgi:ClpP class serine protease